MVGLRRCPVGSVARRSVPGALRVDHTGGTDPEDLIAKYGRYVDERSATVLIGAGLSRQVGYPGWGGLLAPMQAELNTPAMDDMALLAEYFVTAAPGNRDRLDRHVIDTFAALGDPAPARVHRLLAELPIDEYWTTNYDPLVERAIGDPHIFANDEELATASVERGQRRVNKMHGSIDPAGPLILTRTDYENYPNTHPRFWQLLQAQFLTKTFLFLGFSFTDPNLELVFKLVRTLTSGIRRDHFAIMKSPDPTGDSDVDAKTRAAFDLKIADLENVGVHVVVVDSYDAIDEILSKLVARCRPPQLMISGSTPTTSPRPMAAGGAYPTAPIPAEIADIAAAIGDKLAGTAVAAVAGGEVGSLVGYQMCRTLVVSDRYDPDRFTLVRRRRDDKVDPPNTRLGNIVFTGDDPTDLRSNALRRVRALLVLGGSDGTRTEVDQAFKAELGVVPVGRTGGTAQQVWQDMQARLSDLRLGGRPIDATSFEHLMSDDVDQVAAAAVALCLQALSLD